MTKAAHRIAWVGVGLLAACGQPAPPVEDRDLRGALEEVIEGSGAEVGLYYRDLGQDGDSLAIGADVRMHAASTMKVPVMMRLFLDDQEGIRSLDDSLPVKRTFSSIVDGSAYDLPTDSDSDTTFYDLVGSEAPIRYMIERMITWSSNLATNILIEHAEPERIAPMLAAVGADSMHVLRGVEDLRAFEAGLSNTTTARALGATMAAVATSEMFSDAHREEMVAILRRQNFTEGIPRGVPGGASVANKTGWITGIRHDAAIVYPPGGDPYVLVVMVRGHPDDDRAPEMIAELSRTVWELR